MKSNYIPIHPKKQKTMEYNIIHNRNCMEMSSVIEDNSIDCIITDPPYGISYQSARRTDKALWKPKIANDETPYIEWIKPVFEKLRAGGRLICFYRWDVQDEFLSEIEQAGFTVKSQIVWDKVIHGMGDLKGEFAPQHELMIYATKGRYEFQGNRPKTIYRTQRVRPDALVHPNEKPVNLIQAIIRDITSKDEVILDLFSGSGSTSIAANIEGRKYIAFELDKGYVDVANKRIKNYSTEPSLFML